MRWEIWSADETVLLATFGDGTGEGVYPFVSASIRGDRNADCRYAATLVVPNADGQWNQDETNPAAWAFAENNWLICIDDNEDYRFTGLIDDAPASASVGGMPTISIKARSIEKKAIQECFTDTTSYIDTPTESINYASSDNGATATASSYVQEGDQLQLGARIVQVTGRKQVLGIWQTASPSQDASAIKDGNNAAGYSWSYAETGLGAIELTVRLDLWTPEDIQILTAVVGGTTTVTSLKTSEDGFTWTTQTNPAYSLTDVRFIEVTCRAAGTNSATLDLYEINILADNDYPASAALDDDTFTSWRPDPDDLSRDITIDFGASRTFNAIYLQWGVNPLDVWDTVKFKVYNGSTLISDNTDRWYSGLVEIALDDAITASSIKIRVIARAGLTALRHIEVLNITADQNKVSWMLSDLATNSGITAAKQDIAESWFWRSSLTAQMGDTYWQHMKETAETVGWGLYGTEEGKLKAGPLMLDAAHPVREISTETASITGAEKQPPTNIRNYVIIISEQSSETIRSEALDDSINSPTSVQRMGNRVEKIQIDTILTQKAADQRSLLELWQLSRWRSGLLVRFADASIIPRIEEVVRFVYSPEGIDGIYLVDSYNLDMQPGYVVLSSLTLVPVG